MAIQFSILVGNARLNAIETTIGASAILRLRTGAPPATCATADSGTVVATLNLPADYMSDGASRSKAKLGTWEDLTADAAGTVGHFRLYASDGVTCGMQGTVTLTAGGGDMTLDNVVIEANQKVTVTGFSLTDANG